MTVARVVIAGGGIGGLTLAHALIDDLAQRGVAADVRVIEAAADAGGHARTIVDEAWVVETGPNGFLDNEPETLDLIRQLGLEARTVESNVVARRRFVVRDGRLCKVPESPAALLASDCISWRGKLRLLREPWAPGPPNDVDETVFDFAERRIGREATETFVDTAVSGISAGDSRTLSLRSQFPNLHEWERTHGSLFRAMLAQPRRSKGRARLLSFDRGLGTLTTTLSERLRDRITTGVAVDSVCRQAGSWRVGLSNGTSLAADHVVLAMPSQVTSRALRAVDGELSSMLAAIPYAGLSVVALAYPSAALPHSLDGYGYLVPRAEKLSTLGVLWESSIFAGRAPADGALLRVFLGGALRPDVLDLSNEELVGVARREIAQVMGLTTSPSERWVFRWPSAIAQYTVGHHERVTAIRARLVAHPGLDVCGTAYDGVSFNSAIANARRTARDLA
ncbi:MAG: protoporphyrinogen oxidase, partial [Vicinamibacterales bacterium]